MYTSQARTNADLPEVFNAAEDLLAPNLAHRPAKTAIIDHRGACSYGELGDRVARMAGVFGKLGVKRDQRVLLCLTDTRDFPTVFLGAIRAGGTGTVVGHGLVTNNASKRPWMRFLVGSNQFDLGHDQPPPQGAECRHRCGNCKRISIATQIIDDQTSDDRPDDS